MLEGMNDVVARINEIEAKLGPRSAKPATEETFKANTIKTGNFGDVYQEAATKSGIDANLLRAVAEVESGGNPNAVSSAGAMGMMQLMPGTASSLGVENPFDARENVIGGAQYLKKLSQRYGDLPRTLAAYNAGPGAVDRHGGVPPYQETQNYIKKVIQHYQDHQ